jgi:RNA-directed DNA polymerase
MFCTLGMDFVCCFQLRSDAERFYTELQDRLCKFNLEIAEDKTKIIPLENSQKKTPRKMGMENLIPLTS